MLTKQKIIIFSAGLLFLVTLLIPKNVEATVVCGSLSIKADVERATAGGSPSIKLTHYGMNTCPGGCVYAGVLYRQDGSVVGSFGPNNGETLIPNTADGSYYAVITRIAAGTTTEACRLKNITVAAALIPSPSITNVPTPAAPGGGGGGRPVVPVAPGAVISPETALDNTKEVVQWIYRIVLPLAVIIAVARILLFLISMATSQGDPQKLAEVKDNMYATIVGLIVIAGAVSVVTMLGNAIGL